MRVISKSNEPAARVRFEFTSMISDQNCTTEDQLTLYYIHFDIAQFNRQICQTMAFWSYIFLQRDWLVLKCLEI